MIKLETKIANTIKVIEELCQFSPNNEDAATDLIIDVLLEAKENNLYISSQLALRIISSIGFGNFVQIVTKHNLLVNDFEIN